MRVFRDTKQTPSNDNDLGRKIVASVVNSVVRSHDKNKGRTISWPGQAAYELILTYVGCHELMNLF